MYKVITHVRTKMSAYCLTALVLLLSGQGLVWCGAPPATPAAQIMDMLYDANLRDWMSSLDYLQHILRLDSYEFSTSLSKMDDYKEQQRIKERCAQLNANLDAVRIALNELYASVHENNSPAWRAKFWNATAGLGRFYLEVRQSLGNNFATNSSKQGAQATMYDAVALAALNELEKEGKQYADLHAKDPRARSKELFSEFGLQGQVEKNRVSFSVDQQVELKKMLWFSTRLNQSKKLVAEQIKGFGLTWLQRKYGSLYNSGVWFASEWYTSSFFRTKVIGYGLAAGVGVVLGPVAYEGGFGAVKALVVSALSTSCSTIATYALIGTGQRAGSHIADGITNAVGDLAEGLVEYSAEKGKVTGKSDILVNIKNGVTVKIVRPRDLGDSAIIGEECKEALDLVRAMIKEFASGKSDAERELSLRNRMKNFIYQGVTGAGKTFRTIYIINEAAKEARALGIEVLEAYFPPHSIAGNEMGIITEWFKGLKARSIIFYNLDEISHADPSQQGDKKAYRSCLNFFAWLTESGQSGISLSTTNQEALPDDIQRRVILKNIMPPEWGSRKAFLAAHFNKTLCLAYRDHELNKFASLSNGASMAQLQEIVNNVAIAKRSGNDTSPETVETSILVRVHGLDPVSSVFSPSAAVHFAGKLIISVDALEQDKKVKGAQPNALIMSFLNGKTVAIASAQPFKKHVEKSMIKSSRTGDFIFGSNHKKEHGHEALKTLVAGYIAQEVVFQDPSDRSRELEQGDRRAALEACKKILSPAVDFKDLSTQEQKELTDLAKVEIRKIEDEVRKAVKSVPIAVLQAMIKKITSQGSITGEEYLQLRDGAGTVSQQSASSYVSRSGETPRLSQAALAVTQHQHKQGG